MFTHVLLTAVLIVISIFSPAFGAGEISFNPQGSATNVNQVKAVFPEQMVPFGSPGASSAFDIDCEAKGTGRWVDGRTWVYDFDKEVPAGVKCSFSAREMTSVAGKTFGKGLAFGFDTGGPTVTRVYPSDGDKITEDQVFIFTVGAKPDMESVKNNLACEIEGLAERVGVNLIEGPAMEAIAKEYAAHHLYGEKEGYILAAQCKQNFPNGKKVSIVWGKGIKFPNGIKTTSNQIYRYKTRPHFSASFTCQRENPKSACIPLLAMSLRFSSDISKSVAEKIVIKGAGQVYKPSLDDDESKKVKTVRWIQFKGPFPENSELTVELPPDVKDEDGRTLGNAGRFPLKVKTGPYPSLAKFASKFGIIESADPVLPITVRNIEKEINARIAKPGASYAQNPQLSATAKVLKGDVEILRWLRIIAGSGRSKSVFGKKAQDVKTTVIPKPADAKEMEVIGIPLKEPGFHVVEVESKILGAALLKKAKPMYVRTGALVTNLSASFKWGRESSLVWVTTLDKAEPVEGAEVTIRDCNGQARWEGKTGKDGVAMVTIPLKDGPEIPRCDYKRDNDSYMDYSQNTALNNIGGGLFAFARSGGDITFTHSEWNEGIEPWRFNLPSNDYDGPIRVTTVFDRTLLRAGETVHMKHLIRQRASGGFALVDKKFLPDVTEIFNWRTDQKYTLPVKWETADGSAQAQWEIPKDAKLGEYEVRLTFLPKPADAEKGHSAHKVYESGSFRVEEFRVPLMRGIIQGGAKPVVNAKNVTVDVSLEYLSGGVAAEAPVKLRSRLEPDETKFSDYDGFKFGSEPVKEGVRRNDDQSEDGEEGVNGAERVESKIKTKELILGKAGTAREVIALGKKVDRPHSLHVEMEYKDPSGELQTVSRRIKVWPASVVLGVRPYSWTASKESVKFHVVALDVAGKPAPNVRINSDIFRVDYYTHRKKLIGGFYAYDYVTERKKVGKACDGMTDSQGLFLCETKVADSGNFIIQASGKDPAGGVSTASDAMWVSGKGDWWFKVDDNDRIDLMPERKRYEPGETAVFQVRSPFRAATALVTVEREGIISATVEKISGKEPVIRIPVKDNYGPNVFVSALLARGRAAEFKPTAMIDLGKPSFKLGIAEISVGWKAYELKVDVKADKDVYKTRENVRLDISAKKADGSPAGGATAIVAIVDEGLLELMPNESWKLLDKMMGRRGYEISTCVSQTQVVGKRHFGLKAISPGGGGGRLTARELFDTLVYWKGSVPLDKDGKAVIDAKLNDSITGFRAVAVVSEGADKFGSGQTTVRANQDLTIFAGLPPKTREGDSYQAGFTIRNASPSAMDITVSASMAVSGGTQEEAQPKTIKLKAGGAQVVEWPVIVPRGARSVSWKVTAKDSAGLASDSISRTQEVLPVTIATVRQSTITHLDKPVEMAVERPKEAEADKGGTRVTFTPRIAGGLPGVREYMERYPYSCMEQKVSRAVALADKAMWLGITRELPSYLDADGLVKFFPQTRRGSEVLTAYILSISQEAGLEIADEIKNKMTAALERFVEGKLTLLSPVNAPDLPIRKLYAMEALARCGKAKPGMVESLTIEPLLWPTSALVTWLNFLRNTPEIPNGARYVDEGLAILKSRLYLTGATLALSDEKNDYMWWLMSNPDSTAARGLLAVMELTAWKEDAPMMARGLLMRQYRGRWSCTISNAWGTVAMNKFSSLFESAIVSGAGSAQMEDEKRDFDWAQKPDGTTFTLAWPKKRAGLVVAHNGSGKPWAVVESLVAAPVTAPVSQGFTVTKTVEPVDRKNKGKWSVGDVARVTLKISSKADMSWVAVNDPVPAGASILGSGLGRDSALMSSNANPDSQEERYVSHLERTFSSVKAYYEYSPKGSWTHTYTMRLNTEGSFNLPETSVEALYAPEMMGAVPNGPFVVGK